MPEVVHPALYPRNLFPSSKITLFWPTRKSPQLADRSPIVPSGGTLGGGSAINWMVYTRAQRSDFDSWKTPGWSADELLPYLNKARQLGVWTHMSIPLLIASTSSRPTMAKATKTDTALRGQSIFPRAPTSAVGRRTPSSKPRRSSDTPRHRICKISTLIMP